MFYFFLSHARADAEDPYFKAFYRDFLEELRGRVGASTVDGLAFRDSDSIALGAAWEPNLEEALLVSRTLIAMLSPTYLQRPACAKEWAGFESRLRTIDGDGTQAALLLPLVWIPIPDGDLPPVVRRRQLAHASLGPAYAARGLRHVVQRDGTEYRDLLTALAERVRDLARLPPLPSPATLVMPGDLPDPFVIPKSPPASVTAVTPTSAGGPKHVEFFVIAARQVELQTERSTVTAYGAEFDEWCPYLPVRETHLRLATVDAFM